MATKYKNLPPVVNQIKDDYCWAAALESWLRATPGRRVIEQLDLPSEFPEYIMTIGKLTHYLNPSHLVDLAKEPDIRMSLAEAKDPNVITSEILADFLGKGYLYLCTFSGSAVGHCYVVYGVGYPDGKTEQISVMDPAFGAYRNIALSKLKELSNIRLGWPK